MLRPLSSGRTPQGRPTTQCNHCRELRKSKQVHVKCMCAAAPQNAAIASPSSASGAEADGNVAETEDAAVDEPKSRSFRPLDLRRGSWSNRSLTQLSLMLECREAQGEEEEEGLRSRATCVPERPQGLSRDERGS
jgi:hypothetical protein